MGARPGAAPSASILETLTDQRTHNKHILYLYHVIFSHFFYGSIFISAEFIDGKELRSANIDFLPTFEVQIDLRFWLCKRKADLLNILNLILQERNKILNILVLKPKHWIRNLRYTMTRFSINQHWSFARACGKLFRRKDLKGYYTYTGARQ